MKRREFITLVGGAGLAWPLGSLAQQSNPARRIGVFIGATKENDPEALGRITALRQGLEALGWKEGHNLQINFLFGGGDQARIQALAAELVSSAPDVIVANSSPVVAALKKVTRTIPIVFAVINDPVAQGFIANLARPGGNITGFTLIDYPMLGKWLEMLKEMVPSIDRASLIFNPDTAPYYSVYLRDFKALPKTLAVELLATPVHNEAEIEGAIGALARNPGAGLISAGDPFTVAHRALIIHLAERHRMPAIYQFRQFAAEGGLMSYGPDTHDIFRRSASYVDRILKGEKPADLPAQAPTKFELVINLKTAKALGLTVPSTLLARADELIE
jgi:putative tryptophan/tyrosine transport system substrate-binding protein